MLKYYVLCSRNIHALRRHERTIPVDQLVIVINTLDKQFEKEAKQYSKDRSIPFYITESDGTAPTGKNCLYDVFRASNDSHMVMIDGDDYVTDHGYNVYEKIYSSQQCPDVLALEYQYAITASPLHYLNMGFDAYAEKEGRVLNIADPDSVDGIGLRPFVQTNFDFDVKQSLMRRWHGLTSKYIHPTETHLRVTLVSKKAVIDYRWPQFNVGEDTLLYLQYKDAHARGELTLAHHYEGIPTYVYDMRVDGVCAQQNRDERAEKKPADWLKEMLIEMEAMEGRGEMHSFLPQNINVNFPESYHPSALNLPQVQMEV